MLTIVEEDKSVADTLTPMVVPSLVADSLISEMDKAVKGLKHYSGAVGTIELDNFIQ